MSDRCQTCNSPSLHPAVQHEGEVSICSDPFHQIPCNHLAAEEVASVLLMVFGGGSDIGSPDPDPMVMEHIIMKWSGEERQKVVDFAGAVHAVASDNEGVEIPEKPACLVAMMNEMDCQFA